MPPSSRDPREVTTRPVLGRAIVDSTGREVRRLRVFCTRARRSTDLEACQRCPAFVELASDGGADGCVACVPLSGDSRSVDTDAGSLIREPPLCVGADVAIAAIRPLIAARSVPFVLVVNDAEQVVGILWPSRLDRRTPAGALARDVMSVPWTAHEAAPIREALVLMATAHLRSLPIVAPDGTPVGVLRDVEALRAWVALRRLRWP